MKKVPDVPLGKFVTGQKQAREHRDGRTVASKSVTEARRTFAALCAKSDIVNAADVSISTMRSGSFAGGWRYATRFTIVHRPTGAEVTIRSSQTSGEAPSEYRDEMLDVLTGALKELEQKLREIRLAERRADAIKRHG
jgi:hypothetical protein